ncbi:hypothetical protein H5968_10105 [Sphaerospermopsis sp. LEGE 00249]|nr:hypothetical protein [Sphaerospermopsis sp. LEGE 00249]
MVIGKNSLPCTLHPLPLSSHQSPVTSPQSPITNHHDHSFSDRNKL